MARALEALGRTEEAAEIKSQMDDFEIAAHSYPTLEIALFSVGWLAYEGQIFIYAPTLQHAVHEYLRRRLRGSTQAYPLESVRCSVSGSTDNWTWSPRVPKTSYPRVASTQAEGRSRSTPTSSS